MPIKRTVGPASNLNEPEKPVETEEQVELDGDDEDEEEIEYEEVEEEVELEEEVEEVEEEVEEEEEGSDGGEEKSSDDEDPEEDPEEEDDVEKKHAELLALPPHGSEVYIGGFSHDASEGDVRKFCESIGEVIELRMMKGKEANKNKRYAFVTFRTKELASKAIKKLNGTDLKGRKVKCSSAQAKHKLFIGNVPRNWGQEDMKRVVKKVGPGVVKIELLKDPMNSSRNRGFAFIEYYNNACAEYSRQKMSNPKFKLDDNAPTVSWADPRSGDSSAASSSSSSQVKAVYVKNLPKNITQDQLKELFEHHGKITKVVLPPAKPGQENSRYGFVHFADRSSAMKALKNTERYEIAGKVLDCSLAKPQADQKSSGGSNLQKGPALPVFPPRLGYNMVGAPYAGLGAGIGHPLAYGRGATPAGMAMMPLLLPDGRIGYVLQQPGVMPTQPTVQGSHSHSHGGGGGQFSGGGRRGSGGGGSGGGGSGRNHSSDSGRGGRSRYNPY